MANATASPRSKTWKGVAAGAAAIALLAGGGASFAEWRDSSTADSSASISSGVLTISDGTNGTWTNVRGEDVTGAIEDGTYLIVPGDELTYAESMTIEATGDELTATVSTTLADLTGDPELVAAINESASLELDGAAVDGLSAPVTAGNEPQALDVTVTLPFDAATTGTVAQGQTVSLADLEVVLQQGPVVDASN